MDILILHRVPYPRIDYARGIDHGRHAVTYFGKREALGTLPPGLRCKTIERAGKSGAYDEACAWLDAEPQRFDRVISLSEYELLDAARLRERLNVSGALLDHVRLVRDKIVMKRAVEKAGLRVPRFLPLQDFLTARGVAPWGRATVLKPHSGASSADVVVFESAQRAFDAIAGRTAGVAKLDGEEPQIGDYEVEEFVSGPILHFDGLIENSKIVALTASRYIGTCLGFASGCPLGSYHIPLTEHTRRWTKRVLNAVEVHNGSFHLEAIDSPEGLVFLEVGNRVGGADVVATFELATGVHMPSEELSILLGERRAPLSPMVSHSRGWHGWFVYPGHHLKAATFQGFNGAGSFRSSPAIVSWNELPTGAPLRSEVTYSAHEAPLAGIVATQSAEQTRRWIEDLFAAASINIGDGAAAELKNVA